MCKLVGSDFIGGNVIEVHLGESQLILKASRLSQHGFAITRHLDTLKTSRNDITSHVVMTCIAIEQSIPAPVAHIQVLAIIRQHSYTIDKLDKRAVGHLLVGSNVLDMYCRHEPIGHTRHPTHCRAFHCDGTDGHILVHSEWPGVLDGCLCRL